MSRHKQQPENKEDSPKRSAPSTDDTQHVASPDAQPAQQADRAKSPPAKSTEVCKTKNSVVSFKCPECSTRLRIAAKKLAQRKVPCPECKTELWLSFRDEQFSVAIREKKATNNKSSAAAENDADNSTIIGEPHSAFEKDSQTDNRRVQLIAAIVTCSLALVVILVVTAGDSTNLGQTKPNSAIGAQQQEIAQTVLAAGSSSAANSQFNPRKTQVDQRPDQEQPGVNTQDKSNDARGNAPRSDSSNPQASDDSNPQPPQQVAVTQARATNPATKAGLPREHTGKQAATDRNAVDDNNPATASSDSSSKVVKPVGSSSPDQKVTPIPTTVDTTPAQPPDVSPVQETGTANDDKPLIVAPKPIPLSDRLGQKIAIFQQPVAVEFSEIIDFVEELANVELVIAESVKAQQLRTQMRLSLKNTTALQILSQGAEQANLKVVISGDEVQLAPLKSEK